MAMLSPIETRIPQPNTAKQQFDKLLRSIVTHPFVTPGTIQRREELSHLTADVSHGLSFVGPVEVISFPAGSVGAGVAGDTSDSDVSMIYSSYADIPFAQAVVRELLDDHPTVNMSIDRLERPFTSQRDIRRALETGNEALLSGPIRDIFAPALHEFDDPHIKATVDTWRKQALEFLVNTFAFPEAEQIWNLIRASHTSMLIQYEYHGDNAAKRSRRLTDAITSTLQARWPGEIDVQDRAQQMIAHKRANVVYPDFTQMLSAYEIAI